MTCLSCHDGNYAQGAMMKDKVYETLPPTYGTWNTIPTLLGNNGDGAGNYLNQHPVGLNATVGCGGRTTGIAPSARRAISMTGPNSCRLRAELRLLCQPSRLQQQRHGYVHDLPQPAHHERGQCDQRRWQLQQAARPSQGRADCPPATTPRCSSSARRITRPTTSGSSTRRRNSAASAMVASPTKSNYGTAVTTF